MPSEIEGKPTKHKIDDEEIRQRKVNFIRSTMIAPQKHYSLDKDFYDYQEFLKFA
jgi:hypothetical protein